MPHTPDSPTPDHQSESASDGSLAPRTELVAKISRSAIVGAIFLMATSAIGPGFITQTATFTAQMGAAFAFAILASILIDIAIQLNIWRMITSSGKRAAQLASAAIPGTGIILSILIVIGGLAFNIGNIAGGGLGLNALLGIDPKLGGLVTGVQIGRAHVCTPVLHDAPPILAIQLNIWRMITSSGNRAAQLASAAIPGTGIILSILIVIGGLAFNIGNIAGGGLGLNALLGIDPKLGGLVTGVLAIGIFLFKRAGKVVDAVVLILGIGMIVLTCIVAIVSSPPVGEAIKQSFVPDKIGRASCRERV